MEDGLLLSPERMARIRGISNPETRNCPELSAWQLGCADTTGCFVCDCVARAWLGFIAWALGLGVEGFTRHVRPALSGLRSGGRLAAFS